MSRTRKLVLGLAALLSVAVVAAVFALMRGEQHEIDARPAGTHQIGVVDRDDVELSSAAELRANTDNSERSEVHTEFAAPKPRGDAGSHGIADSGPPPSSFIAGDVVDERGQALVDVLVGAVPFWTEEQILRSPSSSHARSAFDTQTNRTDSSGRFRIPVYAGLHFRLTAQLEGFLEFRDPLEGDGRMWGVSDVHIVMHALPLAHFRVIDAQSQQPIERFGLLLCEPWPAEDVIGIQLSVPPETNISVVDHRGGVRELFEQPKVCSYKIEAPGYAPQVGPIAPAAHTADGQIVRLERGGSIGARVLLDGKPTALVGASLQYARSDPEPSDPQLTDARAFLGRTRHAVTTGDGELRFTDLATGNYEFELSIAGKSKLSLERVRVAQGVESRLGDLRMISYPSVKCTLLVPGDRLPAAYKVSVDCAGEKTHKEVDSQRQFVVSNLPPGHWTFELPGEPSFFCDGPPLEFDIAPADKRELALDLRERVGGWLTLNVRLNGASAPGLTLTAVAGPRMLIGGRHTDERGRAVLWVDAANPIDVSFTTANGWPLGRSSESLSVPRGGEVEVTCDLQVGELVVDTASLTELHALSAATLLLESDREPKMLTPLALAAASTNPLRRQLELRDPPRLAPRTALGPVAAGTYRARLHTSARGPQDDSVTSIDYVRDIVIRAGEVNEVRFTEADRVK